ncbi:diguanylate cyclase domain-containing protein [Roseateles sp.]|uniref:diguanylate cyclase domain-containing protein n=1 Tax=Roseateles sp. TaxID=1971397 RepID=UPI00393B2CF8
MRWRSDRLIALTGALLAALLVLLALTPRPAHAQTAEDAELAQLVQQAYDHPDEALAELLRRWPPESGSAPRRAVAWWLARGQILLAQADYTQANAIAEALAQRPYGKAAGWLLRAQSLERQSRLAGTPARQALEALEPPCRRGDELSSVRAGCPYRIAWTALRLMAREQSAHAAPQAAEDLLRHALALAQAAKDSPLASATLGMIAVAQHDQARLEDARKTLGAMYAEAQGDALSVARAHLIRYRLARLSGDFANAQPALETALESLEPLNLPHLQAQWRANLVDVLMHQGRPRDALAVGALALPVLQRFKDISFERGVRHNLAVAHLKLREFDAARAQLDQLAALPVDPDDLVRRSREQAELAETWGELGRYKEALAAYHAQIELANKADDLSRESSLRELRHQYDTEAKQRHIELLGRDVDLQDQQLANRQLTARIGLAVGLLVLLTLALAAAFLLRSRHAQRALQASEHALRTQSERDPLTNLSNRRHLLAVMARHAEREFQGALLMLDLDHFKRINDEHGHAAGDAVIIETARRIEQVVRGSDLVVRWGGEEFLIFAPELDPAALQHLAERLLRAIGSRPIATEAGPLAVTASLGWASFPLHPTLRLSWEQAVNWVDMALYKAKADGRYRAVGIITARPGTVLGEANEDFEAACQRGDVEVRVSLG